MKKTVFVLLLLSLVLRLPAQDKSLLVKGDVQSMKRSVQLAVESLPLFTLNIDDHSQEHDVNSIILDIEKHIDSISKSKLYSDIFLVKHFDAIRHFFLTTTNKTTVASSFLYPNAPYRFCMYNDTALALHLFSLKNGDIYNLSKITEKRAVKLAFENCLLPALKATDEFKGDQLKYIGLSIYYGCKDNREGADPKAIVPYCLTFIARLSDIQQYASGIITVKGLLANAEVYLSNDDQLDFRRIQIDVQ